MISSDFIILKRRFISTWILTCIIVKISSCYLINSNITIKTSLNRVYLNDKIDNVDNSVNLENDDTPGDLGPSKVTNEYSSDDIIVLEGLNAVRKRPGMYIGNTGVDGVHQLLYEILDNSVDEYLAGYCNKISVTLFEDGSVEVSDNGRGIPCDISANTKKSGLETVLTVLHSGGKFQDNPTANMYNQPEKNGNNKTSRAKKDKDKENKMVYNYSSGLHGVGLSVVNALSEYLIVDVFKGNKKYHIELSQGKITKPLTEVVEGSGEKEGAGDNKFGTTVRFLPDYQHIFKNHHNHNANNSYEWLKAQNDDKETKCVGCKNSFILDLIKNRAKELSYLNPGLFIKLVDHRVKNEDGTVYEELFHHTGGTRSFLEELIKDKTPLYKPINIITIKGTNNNVNIEASFSWSLESYTPLIKAYANNVSTISGTHIDGFKTAITRCVNGLLKKYGYFKGNVKPLNGEFIREGLSAILSVKLNNAEFDGQTKTKLGNSVVKTIMEKIIYEQLNDVLDNNKELLLAIHNKSQAAKKAYDAARTAKELIRQKSSNLVSNISGKLTECSSHNIEKNELFIVEGESAAGNAKQARNREFQAVLPLKGKILNIEKISDNNKVLENQQIQLLINAIGLDVNPITWRQKQLLSSLNSYSSTVNTQGSNTNINNIINSERENGNKLRYGKIILLTDADVDGSHLKSLLLCLLYRLCPSLYLEGRVYVATPPLYRITNLKNKKYIYSWSKEELLDIIGNINDKYQTNKRPKVDEEDENEDLEEDIGVDHDEIENIDLKDELTHNPLEETTPDSKDNLTNLNNVINKNYTIQRFKGLGEMMAKQLWETTMDPKKRILKRIVVRHPHEISDIIRLLMGSDVQSRKQYIFNNSHTFQLQDLDI